jgi:hypothetical protein
MFRIVFAQGGKPSGGGGSFKKSGTSLPRSSRGIRTSALPRSSRKITTTGAPKLPRSSR